MSSPMFVAFRSTNEFDTKRTCSGCKDQRVLSRTVHKDTTTTRLRDACNGLDGVGFMIVVPTIFDCWTWIRSKILYKGEIKV